MKIENRLFVLINSNFKQAAFLGRCFLLLAGVCCIKNLQAQGLRDIEHPQRQLSSLPFSSHHFIVISHRADPATAPENSLAAIDSAILHGADYVELDLRTTIDSSLVIMHDATIDRTTNKKGQVSEMPVSILDTCHLKNSIETIPHFESCLLHCSNKINIYLDFKNADVRQTMQVLTKYYFEKSVLVYINTPHQHDEWRKWAPQVPLKNLLK